MGRQHLVSKETLETECTQPSFATPQANLPDTQRLSLPHESAVKLHSFIIIQKTLQDVLKHYFTLCIYSFMCVNLSLNVNVLILKISDLASEKMCALFFFFLTMLQRFAKVRG